MNISKYRGVTEKLLECYSKVWGAVYVLSGCLFMFYMNINKWALTGCITSGVLIYIRTKYVINFRDKQNKMRNTMFFIFSIVLSLVIILGKHLHVDPEHPYGGTIDINYVTGYGWYDALAFLLIIFWLYKWFISLSAIWNKDTDKLIIFDSERKLSVYGILLSVIVLMIFWSPYLYIYYPGFYFGDSVSSVLQALGYSQLDNHFPVMYSLFIRQCIKLGIFLKNDIAFGLAIYSLIQMLFMAFGLSYFIYWLKARVHLKKWIVILLLTIFGTSPYIAQYTIAIWKDPIFSVAFVLATVFLTDMILKKNKPDKIITFIGLIISLSIIVFIRNNGIYIIYAIILVSLISLSNHNTRINIAQILVVCLIVICSFNYVTGPVYNKWGVTNSDEKVESYGIFIAQMARVVALDGKLSVEDKEYMNRLFPLDEYENVYTPCCIDNLKWNSNFDKSVLDKDFFKIYFSILRKNPKICFEAWELQTFGFWSINQQFINDYDYNITGAIPRNLTSEYGSGVEELQIKYVDTDSMRSKLFPCTAKCIPIAYIHWLLIGLAIFAFGKRDWGKLLCLTPALGLMATLIVATPIYYWPRYGFAQQLLLPLFIIFIFTKELSKEI